MHDIIQYQQLTTRCLQTDHTRTRQSSYQVHTDPRFSKQAGPRPPGGLHYLQNHFPQRHQAPAARSCIAESDIGNALGSLLHQEPKSSIAEVEIGRALGSLLHQEPKSFAHGIILVHSRTVQSAPVDFFFFYYAQSLTHISRPRFSLTHTHSHRLGRRFAAETSIKLQNKGYRFESATSGDVRRNGGEKGT
jgi:hypothetical protein